MKKLKIFLTFVVNFLFIVNIFTSGIEEKYTPQIIVEMKLGKGSGEFGFTMLEGDIFPIQTNIAVDSKGNIYILDKVNNRIQKFNDKGEYVYEIPVESFQYNWFYDKNGLPIVGSLDYYTTDICIDSNDNLYILSPFRDGKRNIDIYSVRENLNFQRRLVINKEKINSIFVDELNNLYIKAFEGNESIYKVYFSSYSEECKIEKFTDTEKSKNGLTFLKPENIENKKWIVPILNKDKKRIDLAVQSDKKLIAIRYLRSDDIGNIYFSVVQSDGRYIYIYSPKFEFLTKVKEYEEDKKEIIFRSPMVVDKKGNIYQLIVFQNIVKIVKWDKKK